MMGIGQSALEDNSELLEDQTLSSSYDLTPPPPLPSHISTVSSIGDAQEDRKRETTADWRSGEGDGR
jgi:hypothetical protein